MFLTEFCAVLPSTSHIQVYRIKAFDKSTGFSQKVHVILLPNKDSFGETDFAIEHEGKWYFYCTDDDEAVNNFNYLLNISTSEIDVRVLDLISDMSLTSIFEFTGSSIPADFYFNVLNVGL